MLLFQREDEMERGWDIEKDREYRRWKILYQNTLFAMSKLVYLICVYFEQVNKKFLAWFSSFIDIIYGSFENFVTDFKDTFSNFYLLINIII